MKLNYNNQPQIKAAKLPTQKQLERAISQAFMTLYRSKIGYPPEKIICTIFKNYLVIIAEQALSPLEITMLKNKQTQLLAEVRQNIHEVFKSHLKQLIAEIADREVIDIICKLNIDSGRMVAIAVMNEAPQVRIKYKYK